MTGNFDQAKTYQEVLNWASSFLEKNDKEVNAAAWLMKERFDLTQTDLVFKSKKEMQESDKYQYRKDIKQFKEGWPAQYIVGHEWFYDRKFKVSESTLIPRPETEEWFDRYIKELPDRPLTMVDIGTGSGVLAVSHKLERPQDTVYAVDISEEALAAAAENAEDLEADVTFLLGDLTEPLKGRKFDLIVSNPPYIGEEEWSEMDESVREHEPKQALFAKEEGLDIYKRLAEEVPKLLNEAGTLLMEIGYKQGPKVKEIFERGFKNAEVEVWKDLMKLDRVVKVTMK